MSVTEAIVPLLAAVVALAMAYVFLRRRDPNQVARRMVGLVVLVVGALALIAGVLVLVAEVIFYDTPVMESSKGPHPTFAHHTSLPPGPFVVSIWLLVAGTVIGLGLFIFDKRFSLRSLVIVLCSVALVASMPHVLVPQIDRKTVIAMDFGRTLSSTEWASFERALSKESLCAAIGEPVKTTLPCTLSEAITKVEARQEERDASENSGPRGARLTVRFSDRLDLLQIVKIFGDLNIHVEQAMPSEKKP